MGVLNFGDDPGLESKISACGPLGLQPADRGVSGHNKGVPCGARETVTNPAQPMAPAVPGAPWASPRPSPSLVQVWHFFLAGYLRLKLTD